MPTVLSWQPLYLEQTRLAAGSHVVLVGLIDAGFLWSTMAQRHHPLGRYRKNVKGNISTS